MLATGAPAWTADDMALLAQFPDGYRYEASDGVLEVTPPPSSYHDDAAHLLQQQLMTQVGPAWKLRLTPAVRTATGWRVPDLAAIRSSSPASRTAAARQPTDVGLVVEVVGPTSGPRDRVVKRAEYAEIAIPYYWLIETEPDLMVVAHQLRGTSYTEVARLTAGVAALPAPFPAVVDLEALRPVE